MFNNNIFVRLLLSVVVIREVVSDDPEVNVTANNIDLNVKGKSGAIAIFRKNMGMREKIIDIKMDSIYEVDSMGNKVLHVFSHYIYNCINFENFFFSLTLNFCENINKYFLKSVFYNSVHKRLSKWGPF